MLLSDEDLLGLTGFVRPSKQIEWLCREGFTFRIGGDGHPKVDRAHYDKMMGAASGSARRKTEPDFSSMGV